MTFRILLCVKVTFTVDGVPPKKDGASSMWRKSAEIPRIKALRLAANHALGGRAPKSGAVALTVRIHAPATAGDLDNFATGICDALMAVHPRVPVDRSFWVELPEEARPDRAIAFHDDAVVSRILIERLPYSTDRSRYDLELEWSDPASEV